MYRLKYFSIQILKKNFYFSSSKHIVNLFVSFNSICFMSTSSSYKSKFIKLFSILLSKMDKNQTWQKFEIPCKHTGYNNDNIKVWFVIIWYYLDNIVDKSCRVFLAAAFGSCTKYIFSRVVKIQSTQRQPRVSRRFLRNRYLTIFFLFNHIISKYTPDISVLNNVSRSIWPQFCFQR